VRYVVVGIDPFWVFRQEGTSPCLPVTGITPWAVKKRRRRPDAAASSRARAKGRLNDLEKAASRKQLMENGPPGGGRRFQAGWRADPVHAGQSGTTA